MRDRSGGLDLVIETVTDFTERVAAQRREHFLARAGEVLASSLDYEQTVQTVADLMVPAFADWCTVQLADEEGLAAPDRRRPSRSRAWSPWPSRPRATTRPTPTARPVRQRSFATATSSTCRTSPRSRSTPPRSTTAIASCFGRSSSARRSWSR